MPQRLLVVLAIVASLVGGAAVPRGAAGQEAATELPSACSLGSGGETAPPAVAAPEIAVAPPPGLALGVLAAHRADDLPRLEPSLVFAVRHLILQPGAESAVRRASGPLLFYVERGAVEVAVGGRPTPTATGASVLVATDQQYGLLNSSPEPVSLLRLSLQPPGKETIVGTGDMLEVIPGEIDLEEPERIASRQLLWGEIGLPPAGGTVLFLACLSWQDAAADAGEVGHPGPVGLLVLDGRLRLGEADELAAGDCLVFQPRAAHRPRAGEPPPVVLLVGAVPVGQQLWSATASRLGSEAGPTSPPRPFRCEDPEEAGVGVRPAGSRPMAMG